MERQRVQKTQTSETVKEDVPADPPKADTSEAQKLTEHTDDLLDAIDEILEENAAEFVKGYVQKGGE